MPPRLVHLRASRALARPRRSPLHTSAALRLSFSAVTLHTSSAASLQIPPHRQRQQPWRRLTPPQEQQQWRAASILSALADNPGAVHKRIRRGRGPASGKGKTSGRGHKGQRQHGKVPAGFNGGQTRESIVKGKRGFKNLFAEELVPLNLDRIQSWVDQGRLDPSKPITLKELQESRCTHGVKDGIKLLARNAEELRTPLHLIVSRASATAIAAVESRGGTVTTRYYTRGAIANILRGLTHPCVSLASDPSSIPAAAEAAVLPATFPDAGAGGAEEARGEVVPAWRAFRYRLPDPTRRRDIEYYRDPAHRGYLAHTLRAGEGPSLFFRPAGGEAAGEAKKSKEERAEEARRKRAAREKAENRIF